MFDRFCGPITGCGFWNTVYDFQTLIAGIAAAFGGALVVLAAYMQINAARRDQAAKDTKAWNERRADIGGIVFTAMEALQMRLWVLLLRIETQFPEGIDENNRIYLDNVGTIYDLAKKCSPQCNEICHQLEQLDLRITYPARAAFGKLRSAVAIIKECTNDWPNRDNEGRRDLWDRILKCRIGIVNQIEFVRQETGRLLNSQVAHTEEMQEQVRRYATIRQG